MALNRLWKGHLFTVSAETSAQPQLRTGTAIGTAINFFSTLRSTCEWLWRHSRYSFWGWPAHLNEWVNLQIQVLQMMRGRRIPFFRFLPSPFWSRSWSLSSGLLQRPSLFSLTLVFYLFFLLATARLTFQFLFYGHHLSKILNFSNERKYCPSIQRLSGSVIFSFHISLLLEQHRPVELSSMMKIS